MKLETSAYHGMWGEVLWCTNLASLEIATKKGVVCFYCPNLETIIFRTYFIEAGLLDLNFSVKTSMKCWAPR